MTLRPLTVAALSLLLFPALAHSLELTPPDAKVKLKVGGFLYGAAHFDQNAAGSRPWLITVTEESGRSGFSVEPYGTRLNFGVESKLEGTGEAKGFLELDWGTVSSPRLRHAYVSIDFQDTVGVLVGQYWLPNLPILPESYSPNALLRQGNAWARTPQLSVFRNFGPVKAMVTLAPTTGVTGSILQASTNTAKYALMEHALPAAIAQVAYQLNPKSFIALAGGAWQPMVGFTGASGPESTSLTSWYSEAATSLGFGKLTLGGKVWYGQGAGLGTGVGQSIVMNDANEAFGITSMGGLASAKYAFHPRFTAGLYAGFDDPQDTVEGVNLGIRSNLVLGGTAGFHVIDGGTLGLEVMHVNTNTFAGGTEAPSRDTRGSLIARYSF